MADLSSAFGGGANQIGGVQKTSDFLDKSTWTLATLLLVLILLSNVTIMDGNGVGESKIMEVSQKLKQMFLPLSNLLLENPGRSKTKITNSLYKCQLMTSWHFFLAFVSIFQLAQFSSLRQFSNKEYIN